MSTELSLQQVAKYNKNRTPADHELIYAMAGALGAVRFTEQTGSSYMAGASCLDADGVEVMFVAAGRAYIRPDREVLLAAIGIPVLAGKADGDRVVLFSNAGGSNSVARRQSEAQRASCPTCWMELPASGVCGNC